MKGWLIICSALLFAAAAPVYAQTAGAPAAQTDASPQVAQQRLQLDQQQLQRDQQKLRLDEQAPERDRSAIDQDLHWLLLDQRALEHDQRQDELHQQSLDLNQQQLEKQMQQQMQQARQQMERAARRMAELSMQMQGPMMLQLSRMLDPNRAVLGITLANIASGNHPLGVVIEAVTPGGPAAQGGLRAGDVITSINGTAFKPSGAESAADQLMDFMQHIQPGEHVTLVYARSGKSHGAQVTAGRLSDYGFAWNMPEMPAMSALAPANLRAIFGPWGYLGRAAGWAGMQLVTLTPGLGQYFGTSTGLLVVRAPQDAALKLEDGDVIVKIDERQPASPSDAMRIIFSHAPGTTLTLHILRKNKPLSLSVKMPPATGAAGTYRPMSFQDQ
ncbi:MAG: PDZ domain-containing protein [Gammaproteobacteria bacterium]